MAQIYAVTGMPRNKKGQTMELNARLANLPQMMAQKSQAEYQKASIEDMAARRGMEEKRFGIEQGKLGLAEKEYGLSQKRLGLEEQGLQQSQEQFGFQKTQAEKAAELAESSEQKQMGVKAAGLGFSALGTGGGLTLGGLTSKIGGMWDNLFGSPTAGPVSAKTGGVSDMNIGATLGGGLIGTGAGQIFGGKNKLLKSGIGAAAGGLAGLLGSGGDTYSGIGAGLLGGLGGLF